MKKFTNIASDNSTLSTFHSPLSQQRTFTLAEGATHIATCSNCRKVAFTLAEVLITLGVLGVVAAITMPALMTNVQQRVQKEQLRSAKYKLTLSTDKMKSLGLLGESYTTTEAFINELKKHYKDNGDSTNTDKTMHQDDATSAIGSLGGRFWSASEGSAAYAFRRYIYSDYSNWLQDIRRNAQAVPLCVGD